MKKMTLDGLGSWCFSGIMVLLYSTIMTIVLGGIAGVTLPWQLYAMFALLYLGAASVARLSERVYAHILRWLDSKSDSTGSEE